MSFRSFTLSWAATATLLACAFDANAAVAASANAPTPVTVSGGRYGNVAVTKPVGPMRGFAVLYSAGDHWKPSDQVSADALAEHGALVVGVDTARYATNLAADKTEKTCHNLYGDAEAISHQLERQQESSQYFAPIAIGTGEGGLIATRLLAQAPANTVAGAVSLDPAAKLDPRFEPCPADPTLSRGTGLPGFFEQGVTGASGKAGKAQAPLGASAPRMFT
ncbi:MAG TPA: virulence factor family protein, partial [Paraburkholderia sp.]